MLTLGIMALGCWAMLAGGLHPPLCTCEQRVVACEQSHATTTALGGARIVLTAVPCWPVAPGVGHICPGSPGEQLPARWVMGEGEVFRDCSRRPSVIHESHVIIIITQSGTHTADVNTRLR